MRISHSRAARLLPGSPNENENRSARAAQNRGDDSWKRTRAGEDRKIGGDGFSVARSQSFIFGKLEEISKIANSTYQRAN